MLQKILRQCAIALRPSGIAILLPVIMKGLGRCLGVIAFAVLLSGCGYSQWVFRKPKHHTAFVRVRRERPAIDPAIHTARLYLDRLGRLYPSVDLPPDATFKANYASSLINLFYEPTATSQALLHSLATHYHLSLALAPNPTSWVDYGEDQWDNQVQSVLADEAAQRIKAVTEDRPGQAPRPLVVLIHGYNVSDEELTHGTRKKPIPYFDAVRQQLAARPELRDAAWLEVCWDGLTEKVPVFIWGPGQLNARYAGLALRQVLGRTNPAMPLRIFTHSSGAIVATHLLWNNTAPYKKDTSLDNRKLASRLASTPTPRHCDVRVGMIVPATPPDAFYTFAERSPGTGQGNASCASDAAPLPHYRIVIGQNRKDFAVTKVFFPAVIVGSTTMGCQERVFHWADDSVRKHAPGQSLQYIQLGETGYFRPAPHRFWLAPFLPFWETHDWPLYFQRKRGPQFVDMVLKNSSGE